MSQRPPPVTINPFKRVLAAILLSLALIQIGLFFIGLLVPVRRFVLWGLTREQRLEVIWQPGLVLETMAKRFPLDARIYMVDPDGFLHRQAQYYFLPRKISTSMGKNGWTQDLYDQWDERPTVDWLIQHDFTYVFRLTRTNGAGAWVVSPGMHTPPGTLKDQ